MKIVSWNVNGLRAALKKDFLKWIEEDDSDIICIQETKLQELQIPDDIKDLPNRKIYFNSAEKKGYSGTAIFTKVKPLDVQYDIGVDEHDTEGRVITLEFEDYYLVNVYTPNSGRELARLEYRQEWDSEFLAYLKRLEKLKPVLCCGDLNVAHNDIDLARPKQNHKSAGFTDEERAGFNNIVDAGFVDTFRHFYPDKPDSYTWWSYIGGARARNVGWRIDYFIASPVLMEKIEDAFILPEVLGSDHCPVGVKLL